MGLVWCVCLFLFASACVGALACSGGSGFWGVGGVGGAGDGFFETVSGCCRVMGVCICFEWKGEATAFLGFLLCGTDACLGLCCGG